MTVDSFWMSPGKINGEFWRVLQIDLIYFRWTPEENNADVFGEQNALQETRLER